MHCKIGVPGAGPENSQQVLPNKFLRVPLSDYQVICVTGQDGPSVCGERINRERMPRDDGEPLLD